MNLKHQFYKGYYKKFDPRSFSENLQKAIDQHNEKSFEEVNKKLYQPLLKKNEKIIDIDLNDYLFKEKDFGVHLKQVSLTTIYPGLLSGTGYTHETGNKGELKIGFYFDHTTGLPILPGHSVKGSLRAAFPGAATKDKDKKEENNALRKAKANYIIELLKLEQEVPEEDRLLWVRTLELQIFENRKLEWRNGKEKISKLKGRADTFLSGQISATVSAPDGKGKILGSDAITPHGDNALKNPTPLPFVKVLPGVTWQFSWLLYDYTISTIDTIDPQLISADKKKNLFACLLTDQGIGAKTNVGYGQLIDEKSYEEIYLSNEERKKIRAERAAENKREELSSINDEWVLQEEPIFGDTLILFGKIVELKGKSLERENRKPEFKRRGRFSAYTNIAFKIAGKNDKSFYSLAPDTIVKVEATISKELVNGIYSIDEIKLLEVIKES